MMPHPRGRQRGQPRVAAAASGAETSQQVKSAPSTSAVRRGCAAHRRPHGRIGKRFTACSYQRAQRRSSIAAVGYSHMLGGFPGGQAEYLRVPFADVGPIKTESDLPDGKVLFLSDIFPTG